MNSKETRLPSQEHPITIETNGHRVVVSVAGRMVADSRSALILREAKYPMVLYIPRSDVEMSLLESTEHSTYCPYKGDCSYFSIPIGGSKSVNAVWTYEKPHESVAAIERHLAFYRDRVDSIEERAP